MRVTESLEGWSIQVNGWSEVRFLRKERGWTRELVGEVEEMLNQEITVYGEFVCDGGIDESTV